MIPLMKNAFYNDKETRERLAEFITSGNYLSIGEQCFAFEEKFAASQGRKYATLFNSGGSANLALLQALKNLGYLKDGDNIGFSAITWSTNVMPIMQLGMNPIPIDVQPNTLNTMSSQLESVLENISLKAFFATNILGFCGDMYRINRICSDNGIILLEDTCESLGTETHSGLAGSFGMASTFSFYVAHHISTIEGGMVCTNSESLSDMLKIVRANGWDRNLSMKKQDHYASLNNVSSFQKRYTFYDLGYNFKPTEITGFLGLTQLEHLPKIVSAREKSYKFFNSIIKENEDFIPIITPDLTTISCFANPIVCEYPLARDKYIKIFEKGGVEIRPLIAGNIQRQPFYMKYIGDTQNLAGADFIHNCGFYFGNCPDYTDEEIVRIGECLL